MISLGIRPEHLVMTDGPGLRVKVDVAEELGGISYQYGALEGGDPLIFQQIAARHKLRGIVQPVAPAPGRIFAFDPAGERMR